MLQKHIILDLETNGYAYNRGGKIIQLGILEVDFKSRSIRKEFSTYLNPESPIHWAATKIHGLHARDLLEYRKFNEIADTLSSYLSNSIIIGHNLRGFDLPFLLQEFQNIRTEAPQNIQFVDTLLWFRRVLDLPGYKLDHLEEYYGLNWKREQHEALDDCKLLFAVINQYLKSVPGSKLPLELLDSGLVDKYKLVAEPITIVKNKKCVIKT